MNARACLGSFRFSPRLPPPRKKSRGQPELICNHLLVKGSGGRRRPKATCCTRSSSSAGKTYFSNSPSFKAPPFGAFLFWELLAATQTRAWREGSLPKTHRGHGHWDSACAWSRMVYRRTNYEGLGYLRLLKCPNDHVRGRCVIVDPLGMCQSRGTRKSVFPLI